MTAPRIPTEAQWITEIMGAVGQGCKDRMGILGPMASHGYSFPHCERAIDGVLAAMVASGKLERIEQPSHYAKGQSFSVWRLPSRIPMEQPPAPVEKNSAAGNSVDTSSAKQASGYALEQSPTRAQVGLEQAPGAGARPGTITVEQYRQMAGRKRK